MSRVKSAFANGKAFIPFVTAGDPSLEITEQLIIKMDEAGADLIEIGIPFSDPVAEGIVIQQADERALKAGTTTDKIFHMVERVRKNTNVPLAFMTYINPIYTYGTERFLKNCNKCGIDAIIVPDLPFEEKNEVKPLCNKYDVDLISLIAPTSHDRIKKIAKGSDGFVYCVSSMGVTGVRSEIKTDIREMVKLVKEAQNISCAIGFGISTPEQAKEMSKYADGVIVGSAIVKIVAQYGENCVEPVFEYVNKMKSAIKV
ncbi:MAG: tryptophan synthase subunit alpha [Sedimentibacter sp.]